MEWVFRTYLLYAYTMMRNFSKITKAFALFLGVRVLVEQVRLANAQLSKHEHSWARAVYSGALDENLIGSPRIIDPYCRSPTSSQLNHSHSWSASYLPSQNVIKGEL